MTGNDRTPKGSTVRRVVSALAARPMPPMPAAPPATELEGALSHAITAREDLAMVMRYLGREWDLPPDELAIMLGELEQVADRLHDVAVAARDNVDNALAGCPDKAILATIADMQEATRDLGRAVNALGRAAGNMRGYCQLPPLGGRDGS